MSKELKLTPWFPGDVKPVRKGVYQRQWGDGVFYALWNGEFWCMSYDVAENAAQCRCEGANGKPWRGVAK